MFREELSPSRFLYDRIHCSTNTQFTTYCHTHTSTATGIRVLVLAWTLRVCRRYWTLASVPILDNGIGISTMVRACTLQAQVEYSTLVLVPGFQDFIPTFLLVIISWNTTEVFSDFVWFLLCFFFTRTPLVNNQSE